jgi:lipid-A-disaccharide synthase
MSDPIGIFISAGEASGEHYGALLVEALQRRMAAAGQTAQFFGMGGERMAAAGLQVVVRSEDMAVMGITEVVRHLPRIYREFRRLTRAIRERRPAVAVLIDFPDIHFKLAKQLHRLGIPVIFFVSPQLWAWKKHRIKLVQQFIDKMLVIFPFEEQFYREHGVAAEFVGHPLAELPMPAVTRERFAAENGMTANATWTSATWIGLLPGSRPKEIRDNLPEMLAAARILSMRSPPTQAGHQYEFIVPLAPTLNAAQREMVLHLVEEHGKGLSIHLVNDARATLFHARASVVASGTATVEAALIGNPFVVVYRVSPLTYAIAKRVVSVPHVAMANLILGRRVVPELIQNDFKATNIVQQIEHLLPDGPSRQSMMEELKRVRVLLSTHRSGQNQERGCAIDRVAALTLETLGVSSRVVESVQS